MATRNFSLRLVTSRRVWRLVIVVGLLLALLPQSGEVSAQAPQPGGVFSWEIVPCPIVPASDGEVEGRTYDCGVVIVPENYDKPNGRTIELTYLRLRSSSPTPQPDPVVYLSGGPGGSALNEFATNAGMGVTFGQIRRSRDVIVYDQRGTGHSGLLACGPFQAAIGVIAEDRPDLVPIIADVSSTGGGIGQQVLVMAACATGLRATGLDLTQYNSVSSARDIAALTRAIGYTGQYNLYGASYGTKLSLYALRSTPERIRSVVLDGIIAPMTPGVASTAALPYEQYQAIFRLCAADAACAAAYPNLEQRFIALLRRISTTPIALNPPIQTKPAFAGIMGRTITEITPRLFVDITNLNNGTPQGGFAKWAPQLIDELDQGKLDLLRHSFSQAEGAATAAPAPPTVAQPGKTVEPDEEFFARSIDILLDRAVTATTDPTSLSEAWVALAVGDLRERLLAGERQADVIRAMIQLTVLPTGGTRPEALREFAKTSLRPAAVAKANDLVSQMHRHDVRLTLWRIQAVGATMTGANEMIVSPGANLAVNCSDELTYSTRETAQQYVDAAPYPGLVRWTPELFETLYLLPCKFLPPTVLDRSTMDPVTSDIPALLYFEVLDTQTPRSYGVAAAATLSRKHIVEWQNEGHVIAHRSLDGCAGRIASAFFDNPTAQPDAACSQADRYRLTFSLPGEPPPTAPSR